MPLSAAQALEPLEGLDEQEETPPAPVPGLARCRGRAALETVMPLRRAAVDGSGLQTLSAVQPRCPAPRSPPRASHRLGTEPQVVPAVLVAGWTVPDATAALRPLHHPAHCQQHRRGCQKSLVLRAIVSAPRDPLQLAGPQTCTAHKRGGETCRSHWQRPMGGGGRRPAHQPLATRLARCVAGAGTLAAARKASRLGRGRARCTHHRPSSRVSRSILRGLGRGRGGWGKCPPPLRRPGVGEPPLGRAAADDHSMRSAPGLAE